VASALDVERENARFALYEYAMNIVEDPRPINHFGHMNPFGCALQVVSTFGHLAKQEDLMEFLGKANFLVEGSFRRSVFADELLDIANSLPD
jgi:hypothetical protein